MARRYLTEILQDINDDPDAIHRYTNSNHVNVIKHLFKYAFEPEHKMVLPEGDPPFKKEKSPMGLSPVNIISQLRKLHVFTNKNIQDARREYMFISLLEQIHPKEAEILLAVKDQDLERLYPNITLDLVQKAGYAVGVKKPRKKRARKVQSAAKSSDSFSEEEAKKAITKKKKKVTKKKKKKVTKKKTSRKKKTTLTMEDAYKHNGEMIKKERDEDIVNKVVDEAKRMEDEGNPNTDY